MRPLRLLAPAALVCLFATAALAQVDYRPTPPPRTAANDRAWYRNGDPIPFAGDLYYPAGPNVYFNGNTMVPTGTYDGVTLYADTTLEPYSVVFVPIGDKLLRPYEPVRDDTMAGRSGRQPSYTEGSQEAGPPPPRAFAGQRPSDVRTLGRSDVPLVETVRTPIDNLGLWLSFQGFRWTHAGDAIPFDRSRLAEVGRYFGFPVYADSKAPYIIYVPSRANLVAPFKRTDQASGE